MIQFLLRRFVPDYQNTKDFKVRERYGILGGSLGIACNLLLFLVKLGVGILMNSIAVISDAFNNLSDLGASLVTLLGTKMSNAKPDPEHPYGHGRMEYISSLIVSFLILLMGLELLKSSVTEIMKPNDVRLSPLLFLVLCIAVILKLWMFAYNRYLGKQIDSGVLKAAAQDSLNDAWATLTVILSTLLGRYTALPVDGAAGFLVSLMILYSGYRLARDTVGILLGSPPDQELTGNIEKTVLAQEGILGAHDLVIHDYGPGRKMASIHAEVAVDSNIVTIHEAIDRAERLIFDRFGVHLVIHIDPIITDCGETAQAKRLVEEAASSINPALTIHDFRISAGDRLNLIFDLSVPYKMTKEEREAIIEELERLLQEKDKRYGLRIQIDDSFE